MITGGGKGIGRAIALAFAKANAKVIVITGRTEATLKETSSEIENLGCKSVYYVADVTNKKLMQRIFSTVEADFERLDVVVSNAAYLPDLAPLKEIDVEEWWSAFEVNVRGSFIVTQAFLGIAPPGATLINISSAISHTSGIVGFPYTPDITGYSASKLAGVKVMEDVQAEHPELRIFSLHPGVIDSDTNTKAKNTPQDSGIYSFTFRLIPSGIASSGLRLACKSGVRLSQRENDVGQLGRR
jgi:NAD(P)-dependent dehydrogenase (short-subunit alcohol dehydrogenase family)